MDDSGWYDVRLGLSGAAVHRSLDGLRYRKSVVGSRARAGLIAERDRLLWLARIGFPAARVLDWSDVPATGSGPAPGRAARPRPSPSATAAAPEPVAVLVTSAVPGIPISSVSRPEAPAAARSLALLLRNLHSLPTASCPFDRTLSVTLAEAQSPSQSLVSAGTADTVDVGDERVGLESSAVFGELLAAAAAATDAEPADLVVCHGDACLPNVLVDPDTLRPTGIVDVGRLGVADRHQDLALATRSLTDPVLNPAFGSGCAEHFLMSYLSATRLEPSRVDPDRIAFYRLLDEFL